MKSSTHNAITKKELYELLIGFNVKCELMVESYKKMRQAFIWFAWALLLFMMTNIALHVWIIMGAI